MPPAADTMFLSNELPVNRRPLSYYTNIVDEMKNKDDALVQPQWQKLLNPTPIANDGVEVVQAISSRGFLSKHRTDDDLMDLLRPLIIANQKNHRHQQEPQQQEQQGMMMNHRCFPPVFHGQTSKIAPEAVPTPSTTSPELRCHRRVDSNSNYTVVSSDSSSSSFSSSHHNSQTSGAAVSTYNGDSMNDSATSPGGCYGADDFDGDVPINQRHQWNLRYDELCLYNEMYGHCSVPYNFESNPALAQWVRRQRHQKKRKSEGKHSNLSDDREALLDKLGFVWNSHKAGWDGMFQELCEFKEQRGHCNVPTRFPANRHLAIWVKLQRRQYRLLKKSPETSTMTPERVARLQGIGFVWNPRNLKH